MVQVLLIYGNIKYLLGPCSQLHSIPWELLGYFYFGVVFSSAEINNAIINMLYTVCL